MHKQTLLVSLFILTTINIHTANELNSPCRDLYLENLLEELSSLRSLTPSPILLLPIQQQQKVIDTVSEDIARLPTPPPAISLSPKNSPKNQKKTKTTQRKPASNPKAQKNSKRTSSFFCAHPDCSLSNRDWCTQSKYDRHKRKHTGEQLFQCTLCKRPFSQKNSAVTHLAGYVHKAIVESAIRTNQRLDDGVDVSHFINDRRFLARFVIETTEQR